MNSFPLQAVASRYMATRCTGTALYAFVILILVSIQPTADFHIPCTMSSTFVYDIEERSGEVPSLSLSWGVG